MPADMATLKKEELWTLVRKAPLTFIYMAVRILVFYVTKNSGHYRAAQAIELALKKKFNDISVFSLDCFKYINPILSKIIYSSYLSLLKTKPELWEYLYDNPNVVKKVQKYKEILHRYNSFKLNSIIKEYQPHAIVCTQAFPCGLVADSKNSFLKNMPLIAVLTDYYPHSFWLYSEVDVYVVASEESRNRLIKEGIPENKINIFGIPIDPQFFDGRKDKKSMYQQLNLYDNLPTILIMSGSQGVGPLKSLVFSIDQLNLDFQVIMTTGVNESLNKYLQRKKRRLKHKFQIFGYVDNIDELMHISNILVTKPGGLTTAEAISKELPIVIFNPIPGQEKNNTKYLLDRGIALKADNPQEIAILVKELLTNKDKYSQMKKLLKDNKPSNPAFKTADLIYNIACS